MAIIPSKFSDADKATILSILDRIKTRLEHPPAEAPMPEDLREQLLHIVSPAHRPRVQVVYGGTQAACRGHYARSAGYRVLVCDKTLRPEPDTGRPRILAVLFHELIHIARGEELDAEAFENAWFTTEEGARQPTPDDQEIFYENHYKGWWVRMDPHTWQVTDYAGRRIVTLKDPSARRSV